MGGRSVLFRSLACTLGLIGSALISGLLLWVFTWSPGVACAGWPLVASGLPVAGWPSDLLGLSGLLGSFAFALALGAGAPSLPACFKLAALAAALALAAAAALASALAAALAAAALTLAAQDATQEKNYVLTFLRKSMVLCFAVTKQMLGKLSLLLH